MLCGLLAQGQVSEVRLVFTRFVSMLSQSPCAMQVLPLDADAARLSGEAQHPMVLYEPDTASVFDAIVPEYLAGVLYGALCESVASELAARRTAMDSASKNAEEMIGELTLRYNRARQGAVTQEITEIVAGAQA